MSSDWIKERELLKQEISELKKTIKDMKSIKIAGDNDSEYKIVEEALYCASKYWGESCKDNDQLNLDELNSIELVGGLVKK